MNYLYYFYFSGYYKNSTGNSIINCKKINIQLTFFLIDYILYTSKKGSFNLNINDCEVLCSSIFDLIKICILCSS